MSSRVRPDIRAITRLVPPGGNLVQGQSELAIDPALANAASEVIHASKNHYCPAEGVSELREAVSQKIELLNGLKIDPTATPLELLITPGATGGLVAVAHTYLKNSSAIVFEPYYPYHRRILEELAITVNSFSKSWNISGWRLGYAYGNSRLVAPLNNANNVFYVCSPTPLQRALSSVLMSEPNYYTDLRDRFSLKRRMATEALEQAGFEIYDSGSAFYLWARIPEGHGNAMQLNEMLISQAGVAGVPGNAFADSDLFDNYMRFCIAREDDVLESALGRIQSVLSKK